MQQLRIINNPLAEHVSGIIMPIFRSARPYITAYGFQHLMLLAGDFGSPEAGSVHCVEQCFSTARPQSGTGPWHQLYRAARGSPGICHFSFISIFHE